jgi:1,4-dihydroxy-2-naphthoate octaprenyltransferase
MNSVLLFIKLSRPLFVFAGILLYALGVGIAKYLGFVINWELYIFGQVWVSVLQLSTLYFNEYFTASEDQANTNRTPFSRGSGTFEQGQLQPHVALVAGLICITFLVSITILLISKFELTPLTYFIMLLAFGGLFFYSLPPISLDKTGYGELTTTIIIAFLLPLYSFSLQTTTVYRLIIFTAFPLTLVHLSMMLAFEFPDYSNALKTDKRTLLVRLGWENGIYFHNILILAAYLLFLVGLFSGIPKFVVWNAYISLPIAVFQIWQMVRIKKGGKPNWTALTINAAMTFGVLVYFLTFAYWIH